MSYIDIPLTHEHIFFDIIDHQTDDPVVNPQFPIGINTLIEQRGQANDIHKTLIKFCSHSNYNTMTFTDSDCLSDLEDTIEDFVDLVC